MIPERYSPYETRLRVGAVDFTPVPGDVAANLEKITGWIAEAAEAGVGLLVFPEEALTGAIHCDECERLGGPCGLHRSLAETVPGLSTEALARLADDHDMYLVVGMIEQDPDDPDALYNAAAVIGPEGILGTYRKLHLGSLPFVTEGVSFRPGTSLDVFETRYGPIGVQICYDFWLNPEGSRLLALQGARIIVNPTAAFAGGPDKVESMRRVAATRGQENFVFTISANQVGGIDLGESLEDSFEGALPANYAGHSLICGPDFPDFSHIYAEGSDTEGLVVADLDFEVLHRWDEVCPWRQWRATHQSGTSELFATEFAKLVHGPPAQ